MSDRRLPTRLYSERYGIVVCEGGGRIWRRGVGAHHGHCRPILLQPGEVQASTLTCTCAGVWALFFEPSVLRQFAALSALARNPHFRIADGQYGPLVVAAHELCVAVELGMPESEQRARLQRCLESMLDLTVELESCAHETHPAVTAVRDYLRKRAHEAVTLDELARVSRMSRFHLARVFAAHVGLPPHAYQTRLRIERAMALLRSGVPPGEVANLTGFADQSHLTRHFRRIVGVTPGKYALGV